jgi:hypothetical protein
MKAKVTYSKPDGTTIVAVTVTVKKDATDAQIIFDGDWAVAGKRVRQADLKLSSVKIERNV